MKTKTQKQAVLSLLKRGKKLTWITAFQLTGCSGLFRLVHNFRKQGYVIDSKTITFKTRYGTTGSCKVYWLNKKLTPKNLL